MRSTFLSVVALLGLLSSASSAQAAPVTTVARTMSQQDFQFGVSVGQGDVTYFQNLLWEGSITRDQYDETIYALRQSALEHEGAATTDEERDYYRGYYQGLAFA